MRIGWSSTSLLSIDCLTTLMSMATCRWQGWELWQIMKSNQMNLSANSQGYVSPCLWPFLQVLHLQPRSLLLWKVPFRSETRAHIGYSWTQGVWNKGFSWTKCQSVKICDHVTVKVEVTTNVSWFHQSSCFRKGWYNVYIYIYILYNICI